MSGGSTRRSGDNQEGDHSGVVSMSRVGCLHCRRSDGQVELFVYADRFEDKHRAQCQYDGFFHLVCYLRYLVETPEVCAVSPFVARIWL